MNENAGDNGTVFGKAAGTAMGIGVGAAGIGTGALLTRKAVAGSGALAGKMKDGIKNVVNKSSSSQAGQTILDNNLKNSNIASDVLNPKKAGPTIANANAMNAKAPTRVGPTIKNASKEILESAPKTTGALDDMMKFLTKTI